MTPETDEQVLRSFLDEEESLLTTATAEAAQRGFTTTPPQAGDDVTVGVTESRLLWFDDGLEAVERAAIGSVDRDTVAHRSAPTIVRVGSFAMIAGLVAAVVGGLFGGQPLPLSLALAVGGVAAFAITIAVARIRGDTSEGVEKHRLKIAAGDEFVQLWGSEAALDDLETALERS